MSGNNRQQKKPENILPVNEVTTQEKQQTYTPIFRKNTAKIEAYDPTTYKDSQSITDLIALGQQRRKDYEERYKKATKNTKALAWGNLLTQLGKLAGMGNAPVVKEDQTHLLNAFGEADRLRNAYYDIADRYDTAVLNARARERAAHEANWYARQKANFETEQDYITVLNKFEAEKAKNSVTTTTTKHKDNSIEKRRLALEGQRVDIAQQNADTAEQSRKDKKEYYDNGGNRNNKEPYATHTDRATGRKYNISRSDALDIIQRVIDDYKEQKKDYVKNIGYDVWASLQSILRSPESNDNMIRARAKEYLNKYQNEFMDILNNTSSNGNNDGFKENNPTTEIDEDDFD